MMPLFHRGAPWASILALTLIADLISVGGIIVAAIGVAVAAIVAFFTIRNLQRSYWRNLVDERDAEILELKRLEEEKLQERANFAEEQRELRHNLKNQLAAERAKSDLSTVVARIDALEKVLQEREVTFEQILAGVHQQAEVLRDILAELRKRAT